MSATSFPILQYPNDDLHEAFAAAAKGDVQVLERLLKERPQLITTKTTPIQGSLGLIHVAAWHGRLPVIKLLVSHGADLEGAIVRGTSALFLTAAQGHNHVLEYFFENNISIRLRPFRSGRTVLMVAAMGNRPETIRFLLERDPALLNTRDRQSKRTALHHAALAGGLEACKALIEAGADLAMCDEDRCTAAALASLYGRQKCAAYLQMIMDGHRALLEKARVVQDLMHARALQPDVPLPGFLQREEAEAAAAASALPTVAIANDVGDADENAMQVQGEEEAEEEEEMDATLKFVVTHMDASVYRELVRGMGPGVKLGTNRNKLYWSKRVREDGSWERNYTGVGPFGDKTDAVRRYRDFDGDGQADDEEEEGKGEVVQQNGAA